jgi:RNA polymerase sigma factor (sigma-70 family)
VEASAVHAPAGLSRLPLGLPLLRLRSDEQLVALFRAGSDDAFGVIHDRYRQRLFAYVRQMLSAGPRQDAEDVLQDVFVRAYGALRADGRAVNLRAWLYRVAHNRCIDHLRRPVPPPAEIFDVSRKPLHDPVEEAQRREDLARLVQDVARLPAQQRSALLMREIDGLSYADLAGALDVTVPAVKSLLVRARIGLVEAAEARDADCQEIRTSLVGAYDRGVKASAHARRHLRTCDGCREYRTALRGMRRSFAALSPVAFGPLALGAKLAGLAGGGGAAAGGSAAAGGGAAAAGGVATVSACKVAAVVCTAALTGGAAVEVRQLAREHRDPPARSAAKAAPAPAATAAAALAVAPARDAPTVHRRAAAPAPAERGEPPRRSERRPAAKRERPEPAMTHPLPPPVTETQSERTAPAAEEPRSSGGAQAPPDPASEVPAAPTPESPAPVPTEPAPPATGAAEPPPTTSSSPGASEPAPTEDAPPPPEH